MGCSQYLSKRIILNAKLYIYFSSIISDKAYFCDTFNYLQQWIPIIIYEKRGAIELC